MTEGPRGEVLCPACFRSWELCTCEDVIEDMAEQLAASCPTCSEPPELCGCEAFARLEDEYDNDPGPPSSRPGSHFLPAPELDL